MRVLVVAASFPTERIGGAEYQTLLIADGLAELGHEVVFLATDATAEEAFTTGSIAVLRIPGQHVVGRARHRQLVERAIVDSDPDICYVRIFPELQTVVPQCKDAHIPVISVSCHMLETSPILLGYNPKQALWYLGTSHTLTHLRSFLSVHSSAAHICNTELLRQRIQRWFPRKSIHTIYNGQPVPPCETVHPDGSSGQVIWVNNLKDWKRPEIFVELARRLPKYRFVMIGRMAEGRYGRKIRHVLEQAPENLSYLGPKPLAEVNDLISQSDLLLYTSLPVEGFGNSFLQAWFRRVPTVSLSFDLDGIPEREGVGRCSGTFEQLVVDVEELMEDEVTRLEMGRRARQYAVSQHSVDHMVAKHEALFKVLVEERRES